MRKITNSLFATIIPLFGLKPLPDDKILDQTKYKAFADDKLNITKMIISVFDKVVNI